MVFKSINPKNGKIVKTIDALSNKNLQEKLEQSFKMFKFMRH